MMSGNMADLLSPLSFAGFTLRNRIVMPPMWSGQATPDGQVTDRIVEYHRVRAAAGCGLVTVEHSFVHPGGRHSATQIGVHDDRMVPGLARLAAAIKAEGAMACLQNLARRLVELVGRPRRAAGRAVGRAPSVRARGRGARRADARGHRRGGGRLRRRGGARARGGLRRGRDPRRARLPPVRVPVAALQRADRRVRRQPRRPAPDPPGGRLRGAQAHRARPRGADAPRRVRRDDRRPHAGRGLPRGRAARGRRRRSAQRVGRPAGVGADPPRAGLLRAVRRRREVVRDRFPSW